MAVSAKQTFNLDIDEVIQEAYEHLGGPPLTGQDGITARRSLNLLLRDWQNRGILLWKTQYVNQQLVSGQASYLLEPSGLIGTSSGSPTFITYTVTVAANSAGDTNVFYIDDLEQPSIYLTQGRTYRFDLSDTSNSGHDFKLSTNSDGTRVDDGTEYNPSWVTSVNTPGSSGAYLQIALPSTTDYVTPDNLYRPDTETPLLYYFCTNHSDMGGTAYTPEPLPKINAVTEAVSRRIKTTSVTDYSATYTYNDIQMSRISYDQYLKIPDKSTSGRPIQFTVHKLRDEPVLYVWPTPDRSTDIIRMSVVSAVTNVDNSQDNVDIPVNFLPALTLGLAVNLAMKRSGITAQRVQILREQYEFLLRNALDEDRERASLYIVPNMSMNKGLY